MKLVSMSCPSCGGTLSVPDELDRLTCNYCGTQLVVEKKEDYSALRIAEEIEKVIERGTIETKEAIQEGTELTREEINRLRLSQEISSAETALNNLQSEIRSLERQRLKRKGKKQLKDLRMEESRLRNKLNRLKMKYSSDTAGEVGYQQISTTDTKRGCLFGCLAFIVATLICGIPAMTLDESLFSANSSEPGPLFTIVSVTSFIVSIVTFIYFYNPDSLISKRTRNFFSSLLSKKKS